jgi:hypothetical protein
MDRQRGAALKNQNETEKTAPTESKPIQIKKKTKNSGSRTCTQESAEILRHGFQTNGQRSNLWRNAISAS